MQEKEEEEEENGVALVVYISIQNHEFLPMLLTVLLAIMFFTTLCASL